MSRSRTLERRRQRDRRKRSRYVRELFARARCAFEHVEGTMNAHPFFDLVQTGTMREQIAAAVRRIANAPFEYFPFIVRPEQLKKLRRLLPRSEW